MCVLFAALESDTLQRRLLNASESSTLLKMLTAMQHGHRPGAADGHQRRPALRPSLAIRLQRHVGS